MSKIDFTLVSPSKKLFSASADMVVVPAESGDMGVMAGHSPVIGTVRPGTIIVRDGGNDTRLFVESGFMEVNGETLTILADNGVEISDIDKNQATELLKQAESEFSSASEENKPTAKIALDIAKARISALDNQFYK